MPLRLAFASTVTLVLLLAGLLSVLFAAAVIGGMPSETLWILMVVNLGLTLAMWILGPYIMDLSLRWFYRCSFLDFDQFERRKPGVARFMREVCEREGMPLPQIRIIHDDNPTAYTYGTVPWNSRVALSDGLFRFCSEDEVQAVATHELGHIRHYDFAVMTLATALLQLLYETYFYLRRNSEANNQITKNLRHVGWVAYALWWVGTYLVLWLSRTREYMADAFAAQQMGDAAPLQRALVRIAYGLAEVQASNKEPQKGGARLLQATRALGIADPKASDGVGRAMGSATGGKQVVYGNVALEDDPYVSQQAAPRPSFDAAAVEPVLAFDLVNPWAMVSELGSTHPLTGKRLRALEDINAELGHAPLFNFDRVLDQELDTTKLWSDFSFEVFIWYLPMILPFFGVLASASRPEIGLGLILSTAGLGLLIRSAYAYAMLGDFEPATVFELMCDPYASPLRGRPVLLQGEVIGLGDPGSKISEDMMMQDTSGGHIYLNYESAFGPLGNLFFGSTTAKRSIGRGLQVRGWFRRGISQYVDVYDAQITGVGKVDSYARGWQISGGAMLLAFGLALTVLGSLLPRGFFAELATPPDPSEYDAEYMDEYGGAGWGDEAPPKADEEPYEIPSLDP